MNCWHRPSRANRAEDLRRLGQVQTLARQRPGCKMIVAGFFDRIGNAHTQERRAMNSGGIKNSLDQFMAQAGPGSVVHGNVFAFRGRRTRAPGTPSRFGSPLLQ